MLPIPIWKARVQNGRLVLQPRGADLRQSARRRIFSLQHAMQDMVDSGLMQSTECPLQHHHIDGVYVRTIFIPAGTTIVGKIHKHSHANILSKGDVSVYTEDGGLERLTGPLTMVSPAGCKRVVYAHTDTTWTTIHATGETDLSKIEDYVIAKSYDEFDQFLLDAPALARQEVLQ